MNPEFLQLGAVAIIFLFCIKEFFGYLKAKKSGGGNEKMLAELKLMNNNHLHTLQETVSAIGKESNAGNLEIVKAINSMKVDVVGTLGEIKGKLDK